MKFVLVDLFSDKRVIMYGVRLFSFALNAEPLGILSSNFNGFMYIIDVKEENSFSIVLRFTWKSFQFCEISFLAHINLP